jgi:hypothetical protein
MDGQAVLQETSNLIGMGWCYGADARDRFGGAVAACDPDAAAWSLLGALAAVSEYPEASIGALREALWGISGVIPDWSLDDWNDVDGRTQGETLQMLAHATQSLERVPPPAPWPRRPTPAP